jgi:uridine kinase
LLARLALPLEPPLIAIDGLPCAGKSTLVERIQAAHGFECLSLDDFVRPERDWSSRTPAFPFDYIRYDEFTEAVGSLATKGRCSYAPFDWEAFSISHQMRHLTLARAVIVDGVSSLNPVLCSLYGLRVFVESDRATVLEACRQRGFGPWEAAWRELFLPSADLYMETRPQLRADLIVAGRGSAL